MQKILNKKKISKIDNSTMIYIGRPYDNSNKHFGNPFSHVHRWVVMVKSILNY